MLDAASPLEAICEKADRRHVIRRGRVVAETETRRRLGFLFLGFRPKYWWWELVVLTRKLAMVVVMVFFDNMEYFQVLFVTIAVVINLVAQCLAKAYDRVIVNRYEVWR